MEMKQIIIKVASLVTNNSNNKIKPYSEMSITYGILTGETIHNMSGYSGTSFLLNPVTGSKAYQSMGTFCIEFERENWYCRNRHHDIKQKYCNKFTILKIWRKYKFWNNYKSCFWICFCFHQVSFPEKLLIQLTLYLKVTNSKHTWSVYLLNNN